MQVAVLGATTARGRRVVRDLLERPETSGIVLIGTDSTDLGGVVTEVDQARVRAAPTPLTVAGISSALLGADVAVSCLAPAGLDTDQAAARSQAQAEVTALQAARLARVPYVTACEDPETIRALFALPAGPALNRIPAGANRPAGFVASSFPSADPEAAARAAAGIPPLVAGMSWTPGLSNLLVRMGAERFDRVQSVRVAWCTPRYDRGEDGLGRLVRASSGQAEVLEDGQRHLRHPGSSAENVFFPEPVGWQRVHVVPASEVDTLPPSLAGLESLVVKGGIGGVPAAALAKMMVRPPRLPGLEMPPSADPSAAQQPRGPQQSKGSKGAPGPKGRRVGVQARFGLLSRSVASGLAPSPPQATGWSALRVDVTGRSGGTTTTATYGIVDRLHNLESAPLLVACLMLGGSGGGSGGSNGGTDDANPAGHGVVAPQAAFSPTRFLALLGERGVRVAILER